MDQEKTGSVQAPEQEPVQQDGSALERIEKLLIEQAGYNKKMLRSAHARTAAAIAIAIVFVIVSVVGYGLVFKELPALQSLVAHADKLIVSAETDLSQVVDNINEIDFDAVNDALTGIGSIDFDAINTSIQGLAKGVEAFQQFAENLTKPGFGLFG